MISIEDAYFVLKHVYDFNFQLTNNIFEKIKDMTHVDRNLLYQECINMILWSSAHFSNETIMHQVLAETSINDININL